jgi:hypothetical protein
LVASAAARGPDGRQAGAPLLPEAKFTRRTALTAETDSTVITVITGRPCISDALVLKLSVIIHKLLAMSVLIVTSARPAGPILTPDQIQAAIQEGNKYRTLDKFLEAMTNQHHKARNGVLLGTVGVLALPVMLHHGTPYKGPSAMRVQLASAMAMDGISKYATFYNDWPAVAAESAAAHQQMRELKVDQIQTSGLLHAFVEIHGRGAFPTGKMNRRYGQQRAHLVLKIGERIIQPVEKMMIMKSDQSPAAYLAGYNESKITLNFAFDVSPEDLDVPTTIILIDGDGNRHQAKADLKGILNFE